MPKISVIIPVYNADKFLHRCIESIQQQSLQEFEIILVNDASVDNSLQIIRDFEQKDNRIVVINLDKNMGPMYAREKAYLSANGDYIAFCDADDSLPTKSLELLYNEAVKTKADVISANLLYIQTNGDNVKWVSTLNYGNDKISVFKSLLKNELRHNLVAKLFTREILQNYKYTTYKNFTNFEDYILFYEIIENANKIISIQNVVYNYYQNEGSSTQDKLSDWQHECNVIARKLIIKKLELYPSLKTYLYSNFQRDIARQYIMGYNKNGKIKELLNKHFLSHLINFHNIIRYNNLLDSIKLVGVIYLGSIVNPIIRRT